jgi:hypothetical protein
MKGRNRIAPGKPLLLTMLLLALQAHSVCFNISIHLSSVSITITVLVHTERPVSMSMSIPTTQRQAQAQRATAPAVVGRKDVHNTPLAVESSEAVMT